VGYFTKSVARDTEKAEQHHKKKLMHGELTKFMRAAKALNPRGERRRWN